MVLVVCNIANGQKPFTANTLKIDTTVTRSPYSINDISWIAGQWKGVGDSTTVEEHWMRPDGGTMLGMFRYIQAGRPFLYELMTIFPEKRSLTLRLKHFGWSMRGWEHKDSTGISFPLIRLEGTKAYFDGQTYHLADNNTLIVYVAQTNKLGKVTEEQFTYKRIR